MDVLPAEGANHGAAKTGVNSSEKNVDKIVDNILDSENTILIYAHGIETGSLTVSFEVLEEFAEAVDESGKSWLQMRQLAEP